jgi:hypothetical protein
MIVTSPGFEGTVLFLPYGDGIDACVPCFSAGQLPVRNGRAALHC